MQDEFTMRVEIGNAAMQQPEDVAILARRVADLLEDGYTSGPLHDANGNTVGSWSASFPREEA